MFLAARLQPPPPPPPSATLSPVFQIDAENVAAIGVVSSRGRLRAERGDGGWRVLEVVMVRPAESDDQPEPVAQPSAAEIDSAVAELVREMIKLPEIDRFPRETRSLEQFGLDQPQLTLTFTLKTGAKEILEVGQMTIPTTAVYARHMPSDDVLQVGTLLLNQFDAALYRLRGLARSSTGPAPDFAPAVIPNASPERDRA